jgi:hypothetical protein
MHRKEHKDNYKSSLHESYELNGKEREKICKLIDMLDCVVGKKTTESELAQLCMEVYTILKNKKGFRDFLIFLKEEKKFGSFKDTVNK